MYHKQESYGICKGNVQFSTHMILMEFHLVKPDYCKNPVGTQQNKHQPKISIFLDYSFISTLLYENPVGTQDATTLCGLLRLGSST